jgi:integrase
VANWLRPWFKGKPQGQPLFSIPQYTSRTLRWDLKAAGIPYEVDGKRFDFHAFRGAYVSRLERSGASVKALQTLSRHTDPRLTLKRYARLRIDDAARAVEAMPSPLPAEVPAVGKRKRAKSCE